MSEPGPNMVSFTDLHSDSSVGLMLMHRFRSLLLVQPADDIDREHLSSADLLACPVSNSTQVNQLLGKVSESNCPILLLVPSGVELSVLLPKELLIDILELPSTLQTIQLRITFLLRVSQLLRSQQRQRLSVDKQLDLLYSRDGLTGLYNRRHLNNLLAERFQDGSASTEDICLLILNIDYFNSINRAMGYSFGDAILNELAARLTEKSREQDICFRYSGEDFVILFLDTDLETGQAEAERLREECTQTPFVRGDRSRSLTLSGGLVSLKSHRPGNHEEFLCMMETALFVAKAEGRDRIQTFSRLTPGTPSNEQSSMAVLRENLHRILDKTRRSAINSLKLLTQNLAPEYETHSDQLSDFIGLIGGELGLSEAHLQTFENAVTLYDSLRFILHHDLLNRPGLLSASEKQAMMDLPLKLEQLTDMFDYFAEEKNLLLCHGERYDGTGYPLGLKGDDIPIASRIFSLANALAAMSSPRPYRPQLPPLKILQELITEAGGQFDPYLVDKALTALENHRRFGIRPNIYRELRQQLHEKFPELSP